MNEPPTRCPACDDATQIDVVHGGLRFKNGLQLPVFGCGSCGHRWMATSAEEQKTIEENYSAEYTGFRVDETFNQTVADEIANRLGILKPPPAELLDVGCGNGEFLLAAAHARYQAMGVDVSEGGVAIAREKGLDAQNVDFLQHDFGKRFDMITMWDVMEHLRQPNLFIRRSRELLHENGVLILKIPTYGGFNFQVLRWFPSKSTVLLQAPGHVQYFCRESLTRLLSREGFPSVMWFAHKPFRNKPPTRSLKRKLSRRIQRFIGKRAGNHNLYLAASPQEIAPDLRAKITHTSYVDLQSN